MAVVEREVGAFRDRAVYSEDQRYRYEFNRRWGDGPPVVWVLLNPATGDPDGKPRPTLGRCIRWSQHWGYGALTIVNLFAYRATKPKDLLLADHPVGPDNDETLARVTVAAARVVAAWGARTHAWTRAGSSRPTTRRAVPGPHLKGPAPPPPVRP